MPKIDIDAAPTLNGTGYPDEFAAPRKPRRRQRLGDAVGLDQFGVGTPIRLIGQHLFAFRSHYGHDQFNER